MHLKYCPQCGRVLDTRVMGDEGDVPYCEACGRPFFDVAYPCVLVSVINEHNQIALLRQSRVSATYWVLVAGYIRPGETAEECVEREVHEETGLSVRAVNYLCSHYHQKRDCLMLGYMARVMKTDFVTSQEVDDIAWFALDEAGRRLRPDSIGEKVFLESVKRVRTCG